MNIESGYQALQVWDQHAIQTAPILLKVWLFTMALSFASCSLFVKNYKSARVILASVILGIAFTKFMAPNLGLTVYSGLVALTHTVLWPIGLLYLCRDFFKSESSVFKGWAIGLTSIILLSLIFDFRDAFIYLKYIFSH